MRTIAESERTQRQGRVVLRDWPSRAQLTKVDQGTGTVGASNSAEPELTADD